MMDEGDESDVRSLKQQIERTHAAMNADINALERRLSPAELGEQAKVEIEHLEARVRMLMKEGLNETKDVLRQQIEAAKGAVHEQLIEAKGLVQEQIGGASAVVAKQLNDAKEMVTHGLADARVALKKDLETAIVVTKHRVREATIGRVENLATQAGDVMNNTRDTLVETIRQNPVPAALAGVGLAWLLMSRSSSHRRKLTDLDRNAPPNGRGDGASHREGADADRSSGHASSDAANRAPDAIHRVENALGHAGASVAGAARNATTAVGDVVGGGMDAASHLTKKASDVTLHFAHDASEMSGRIVHGAADSVNHLTHKAHDAAGSMAHYAQDQAGRAERTFLATLDSSPLALAAVAAAVGAAVGYSLPRTPKEDQLMGQTRDRLLHGAQDMAHDAVQSLTNLAHEAGEGTKAALAGTAAATP